MSDAVTRLNAALERAAATVGTPFATRLAEVVGSGTLLREAVSDAMTDLGFSTRDKQLEAAVDVTLECVRHCIADHDLTPSELEVVRTIKRLCGIEEGDILRLRPFEVSDLLREAMEVVLHDNVVTGEESMYKVGLQEVFDLGYDEFHELTEGLLISALRSLLEEMVPVGGTLSDVKFNDFQSRAIHLDHVFNLNVNQGDLAGSPGRYIPTLVKEAVWRRDHGMCADCGSNELLEFDHIIPFSLGGSNTYRNVQLLCQTCNRKKWDSLSA